VRRTPRKLLAADLPPGSFSISGIGPAIRQAFRSHKGPFRLVEGAEYNAARNAANKANATIRPESKGLVGQPVKSTRWNLAVSPTPL